MNGSQKNWNHPAMKSAEGVACIKLGLFAPTGNNRRAVPSRETVVLRQTAKTSEPQPGSPAPREPRYGTSRDTLPPDQAALLRKELALQDELADTRQKQFEAASAGLSSLSVWLFGRACWTRVKLLVLGFPLPRPARRPRPSGSNRLAAWLHHRWIRMIGTSMQCPKPRLCICEGSLDASVGPKNSASTFGDQLRENH